MTVSIPQDRIVDWLLTSPPDEVKLIQEIYEGTYNKSLKKALEPKCGKKFFLAFQRCSCRRRSSWPCASKRP